MMNVRYSPQGLQSFAEGIFTRLGVSPEDASITAQVLVASDLRGIDSHGIARLSIYTKRLKEGLINPRPLERLLKDKGVLALLHAGNGLGPPVNHQAMELAITKAKEFGFGLVGVAHSNHYGISAYYSLMAAQKGLLGFSFSNASPTVAPFGGREKMLGTNPLSVAIPANKRAPICLDMATTLVSRGKVEVAHRENRSIPNNWVLDKRGRPTTDPAEGLLGTLLPLGGPKGYGLALIIDIVAGIMTGSSHGKHTGSLFFDFEKPQDIGHINMAFDVSFFMPSEVFAEQVDSFIEEIKASEPAHGVEEIFYPGEIEARCALERKDGIPLNPKVLEDLQRLNRQILGGEFDFSAIQT